jgi:hypothetical protein
MPAFLDEVLNTASSETRALCGNNPECIFDASETGSMEIGLETLQTNQDNNNNQMIACKYCMMHNNFIWCCKDENGFRFRLSLHTYTVYIH